MYAHIFARQECVIDYVSTTHQYTWVICLQNSEFKSELKIHSHKLFIYLQIGPDIWAVLSADAVATGELNKTITASATRLSSTLCVSHPAGLVLHGKQPWLTMPVYVGTIIGAAFWCL